MKQPRHVKWKIISKMPLSLALVLVLVSAITQVHGESPAIPPPQWSPVVTIRSTANVTRGETGLFILNVSSSVPYGGTYVSFSVSGTAIPGVDYVPLVSPAYIPGCEPGGWFCWGVIPVKTLTDPRGPFFPRAYDVVVTLKPGFGYAVGEPSSAQLIIEPLHREITPLPRPTSTSRPRP
jgi:hypothetical protein